LPSFAETKGKVAAEENPAAQPWFGGGHEAAAFFNGGNDSARLRAAHPPELVLQVWKAEGDGPADETLERVEALMTVAVGVVRFPVLDEGEQERGGELVGRQIADQVFQFERDTATRRTFPAGFRPRRAEFADRAECRAFFSATRLRSAVWTFSAARLVLQARRWRRPCSSFQSA